MQTNSAREPAPPKRHDISAQHHRLSPRRLCGGRAPIRAGLGDANRAKHCSQLARDGGVDLGPVRDVVLEVVLGVRVNVVLLGAPHALICETSPQTPECEDA